MIFAYAKHFLLIAFYGRGIYNVTQDIKFEKGRGRMKRKLTALIMSGVLCTMAIAGCSPEKKQVTKAEYQFHETGLPIVEEPIEIEVGVCRPANYPKWSEMDFFKDLEKRTNVKVNFREFSEPYTENINLMVASQEFPDVMFRGFSDQQVNSMAEAGSILPLNDLIEKYAPNWKKIIDENDYVKKVITGSDGNIYSLPFIREDEADYGLRDVWFINKTWLDKLGLDVPETTEEFYSVLKAFKDAAGKELPENAIPWYFRYNQNVGGQFDIFSSFGILDNPQHLMVEDGKAVFTAVLPEAKETVKYLNRLYAEGLFPEEVFTDDWATYISKIKSEPTMVGVFHSYNHPFVDERYFVPMLAPKGPGVEKTLLRKQNSMVTRNNFVLFADNPCTDVIMRWVDEFAKEDESIQILYGTFGKTMEKTDDGKYRFLSGENLPQASDTAPVNFGPAAVTQSLINRVEYTDLEAIRRKYYKDMYKDNTVPLDTIYPLVHYDMETSDIRAQLSTDIGNYVKESFARWIVSGNIDAEWDSYVKKLNDLGLEQLMDIYQKALDEFNAN